MDTGIKDWVITTPKAPLAVLDKVDGQTKGLMRKIIRLVKHWIKIHRDRARGYRKQPFKTESFIVESMIVRNSEILKSFLELTKKPPSWNGDMTVLHALEIAFDHLREEVLGTVGGTVLQDTTSYDTKQTKSAAVSEAYGIILDANRAQNAGNYSLARELWFVIFPILSLPKDRLNMLFLQILLFLFLLILLPLLPVRRVRTIQSLIRRWSFMFLL